MDKSVTNLLERQNKGMWVVSDFKQKYSDQNKYAWFKIDFKKPILIRGIGLKSGGEDPARDPAVFQILGESYLHKLTQAEDSKTVMWKKVLETKKYNFWTERWRVQKLQI